MPFKLMGEHLIIEHRRLILFILVIISSIWLWSSGTIEKFVLSMGEYGYLGAFIGGFFYSYGVTSPLAVVLFAAFSKDLNITVAAVLGGFGAMTSDYIIFKSVEETLKKPIQLTSHYKIKIPKIKSKLFYILSPLVAAIIIGSPLPDELAAVILGMEKLDDKAFVLLSFSFNLLGLLVIMLIARTFI
jgi:hypothetical protein